MQPTVFFDAVKTIIAPEPNAPEVYAQAGRRYGSQLKQTEIVRRFAQAFRKHFQDTGSPYEQPASEKGDQLRWRRIVGDVFQADFQPQLFEELWQHFAQPGSWRVLPNVSETIGELQSKGFAIGIASNFDSRICEICRELFPMIPAERVFYSTQLGFAKPDVRFYKQIESRMNGISFGCPLMIGDNWSFDVDAARRAGWRAVWKQGTELPSVPEIEAHFFRST